MIHCLTKPLVLKHAACDQRWHIEQIGVLGIHRVQWLCRGCRHTGANAAPLQVWIEERLALPERIF
jgi:hypothetical protein